VTTLSTVGYGDISSTNTLERITNITIMIFGVILLSSITG
jgi:hypothetical protein